MQGIMINRKLFGNFGFSSTFAQSFYLFTLRFSRSLHVWRKQQKTKTEAKKPRFCRFCRNTSVFVANKTLICSDLWVDRAKYTPPHPFLTLAGWVSSRPKIFYFFIFYFCKILWFLVFCFSTEFWAFLKTSYLLFLLHKVS